MKCGITYSATGEAMISKPAERCSPIHAFEAKAVHRHDQVEVSLQGERRVVSDWVKGSHEVSEAHPLILARGVRLVVQFR